MLIVLPQLIVACGSPSAESQYVQARYDANTGKLDRLAYDANKNGTPDSWSYMNGTAVLRVEIDKDEDGRIERWEYYGTDQKLEKVGISRANDGKVDAWVYQSVDGTLSRFEVLAKGDGRVSRTEFYEKGALVRGEEDTDGDGVVDKWETFAEGALTSVAFDTDGAGRPTRRLVYGKDGSLLRIETGPALQNTPS